jgi:hypothetical protein
MSSDLRFRSALLLWDSRVIGGLKHDIDWLAVIGPASGWERSWRESDDQWRLDNSLERSFARRSLHFVR